MASDKQRLLSSLSDCKIADRFKLSRRINGLKGGSDSAAFQQVAEAVDASRQWVKRRRDSVPTIHYPELPISERRVEIAKAVADHQVVVIAGETGSGKTTQLPKVCLELGLGCRGLIGHTQPRRLAARAVASRIAEELNSELGERVGYQVRFQDQVSDSTQIKLMTDGILLAQTQHDRFLEQYDTLIIDEAHERSLNIDFLLGYIKRILPKRPDLKVIVTSATIDLERFSQFFDNAPIIEVSGRTYPVTVHYRPLDELQEQAGGELDQAQAVLAAVRELELLERKAKSPVGDILVFLSGERDIREAAECLRRAQLRDTDVLPLYARLSNAEQNRIFHPSGRGRRIVLATNVAETSLTVPGIRYVIDPGFARISRYSYRSKVQRLPIEPVSRASANQRKGRCGRVAEGICIRLYSEEDFNNRPAFTDAEILRTNLASVILQMEAQKLGAMEAFPFIDPPDPRQVRDGVRLLEELGAMADGRLTAVGRQLSRLPVDPRLGRMLVEGARNNCLHELLILTAVLGIQDPRERPLDKKTQADQCHAEYRDDQSDFITLLNLWQRFEEQRQALSQNQLRKYCQKQFLSYLRMREWRDLHRQLLLACKSLGLKANTEPAGYAAVHRSLLAGLLGQLGFRQENREYQGARNRKFMVFPGSPLSKAKVKWIMAAELVETSRLFARMVAKIEPEWVEKQAAHLVKRSYSEPHWEKKRREVVAYEQVSLYGLVIVARRKVSFGRIDPDQAQQIFIRAALVEGEYDTQAPFFKHNRDLLQEVAALEDKSRRRDILIDDDQLFDFYREVLLKRGGETVVNGAAFEKWRTAQEAQDPELLFLTKDYLMRHDADQVTSGQYPDTLRHDGLQFRLKYHFDPAAEDDGVTLEVPAGALKRLPLEQMEWLVPGMLEQKCIALLKALPKTLRKQVVPVPDHARAFLATQPDQSRSLKQQLAAWLQRKVGAPVSADIWDDQPLESHLQFNIRVLDAQGRELGQGRDWDALNQRYAALEQETDSVDPQRARWERPVSQWDFGDLPDQIELTQAGMKVPAYPALCADADKLSLQLYDSPVLAQRAQRQGVVGLLANELSAPLKELRRSLAGFERCALQLSQIISKEALWADFAQRLLWNTYIKEETAVPRKRAAFIALLQRDSGQLLSEAQELLALLEKIATHFHGLSKKLKGSVQIAWVPILNDIRGQLEQLVYPGFLNQTPWEWLQRFPVYLEAMAQRLEKYQQDLQRQRVQSDELQRFWQRYAARAQQDVAQGQGDEELQRYRWMLEEYRVSLFAQPLGTVMPVSAKRINAQWQRCTG